MNHFNLNKICRCFTLLRLCVLFCMMYGGIQDKVWSQNVYATIQRTGTTGPGGTVTAAGNAVNAVYTDSCRLSASSLVGTSTAYIQLIFASAVPANTTIFIRYKSTGALLGGGVALQTYTGATASADGTTTTVSSAASFTAPDGTNFMAVSSTAGFNAVRVTLSSPVALGTNTADIFYGMYVPAGTGCAPPVLTATSITGLLSIGGSVSNPQNAIDTNLSTSSTFAMGVGVGAALHQDVYFSNLSAATDAATITLSVPPSLISLGLLNTASIVTYNGSTQVGTTTLGALLGGTDLLTLLQAGNVSKISYAPGAAFNRIEVVVASLAGVATSLNLYEVQRTPPRPAFTGQNNDTVTVCNGGTAILTADAPAAGNELRWYATASPTNNSVLYTGNSYTIPFAITQDTVFYVAAGKTGCTASSERVPVRVLTKPLPDITFAGSLYLCQSRTSVQVPYTNAVNSPVQYSIAWGAAAVTAGFQAVATTALPASPISLSVPGAAVPQAYPGILLLTGSNGCTRSYAFTLTIQATPHPAPPLTSFQ